MSIEMYFKQEYPTLIKRIKARGMQEADAEDVVQEAFYRALKYFNSFNPKYQPLGAWFSTILNNSFKAYRHANYTGDYSFREEDEEPCEAEEENREKAQLLHMARNKINKLPPSDRAVVHSALILGYSYRDCCKIYDIKYHEVIKSVDKLRVLVERGYEGMRS